MKNEILTEVWLVKESLAAEHGYNVRRLAESIQKKESLSHEKFVTRGGVPKNKKLAGKS